MKHSCINWSSAWRTTNTLQFGTWLTLLRWSRRRRIEPRGHTGRPARCASTSQMWNIDPRNGDGSFDRSPFCRCVRGVSTVSRRTWCTWWNTTWVDLSQGITRRNTWQGRISSWSTTPFIASLTLSLLISTWITLCLRWRWSKEMKDRGSRMAIPSASFSLRKRTKIGRRKYQSNCQPLAFGLEYRDSISSRGNPSC